MRKESGIIWLDETDSTNSETRRRLASLDNLSIIAAVRQTAGRGQGDHKWSSEAGQNLTFTVLLDFKGRLDIHNVQTINDIVTGATMELLEGEGIREVWVKAPNDIWVGDRKIAGILIENILEGSGVSKSIVGVGLNVNQCLWPSELPNPVSMKQLTGKEYRPTEVLEALRQLLRTHFKSSSSKIEFIPAYLSSIHNT